MRKLAATQIIRQMARLKADIAAGRILTDEDFSEYIVPQSQTSIVDKPVEN